MFKNNPMKRNQIHPFLLVLSVFSVILISCKKEESLSFDYHGENIIITLRPDSASPTTFDTTGVVYFNADSMAKANKFPTEALKEITVTDMEFSLLSPAANGNFDLIESMNGSISLSSNSSPASLFSTDKISLRTSDKIVVSGINQNIKDKVFNNKYFNINLSGALKDSLLKPINIEVRFTYAISMVGVKI